MTSIPIDSLDIPSNIKQMLDNFTDEDFDDNVIRGFQILAYGHLGEDLDFTQEQFQKIKSKSALLDIQLALQIAADEERFNKARVHNNRQFPRNKAEVLFYLDLVRPQIIVEYIDDVPVSTLHLDTCISELWSEMDSELSGDENTSFENVVAPSDNEQIKKTKRIRKRGLKKSKKPKPVFEEQNRSPPKLPSPQIHLGDVNTPKKRQLWRRLAAKERELDHFGREENLDVRSLLIMCGKASPFKSVYYSKTYESNNHTINARRWITIPDEIITDDWELFEKVRAKEKIDLFDERVNYTNIRAGDPTNIIEQWFDCLGSD